ncbi:MAG: hypothetical protein ACK5GX_07555, partial [Bacteroidota bacterium]
RALAKMALLFSKVLGLSVHLFYRFSVALSPFSMTTNSFTRAPFHRLSPHFGQTCATGLPVKYIMSIV